MPTSPDRQQAQDNREKWYLIGGLESAAEESSSSLSLPPGATEEALQEIRLKDWKSRPESHSIRQRCKKDNS